MALAGNRLHARWPTQFCEESSEHFKRSLRVQFNTSQLKCYGRSKLKDTKTFIFFFFFSFDRATNFARRADAIKIFSSALAFEKCHDERVFDTLDKFNTYVDRNEE